MKVKKKYVGSEFTFSRNTSRQNERIIIEDTPEFAAYAKSMGWDWMLVKERKKKEEVDEPQSDQEGND